MEPLDRPPARGAASPATDLPAPPLASWIHPKLSSARPLWITAHQRAVIAHWSEEGYPHEACGLLVGRQTERGTEVVSAHRARNVELHRPEVRFTLAPEDWLRIEEAARADRLEVVGVWHSHPDHSARPSESDHQGAWEGLSYLIAALGHGGVDALRSWRLVDGRFAEQPILERAR